MDKGTGAHDRNSTEHKKDGKDAITGKTKGKGDHEWQPMGLL